MKLNSETKERKQPTEATAGKKAEKDIELFRNLIDQANDAIFVIDPETGIFLDVNSKACGSLGYDRDELLKMAVSNVDDAVIPHAAAWIAHVNELKHKGHIVLEGRHRRKDRTTFPVEVNVKYITLDKRDYMVAVARDITGRKSAEEALRASEERYRSLFENMAEGLAYCRMIFEDNRPTDFIYLDVNSAFEKLTGLKNVIGKRVTDVIPGIQEADPKLFEIYSRVSLTGTPERFEMFVESLKTWFSISVYSPAKEFFVAVFDVITDRKRTEELLKESEERYRSVVENIGIGIAVISPSMEILSLNQQMKRWFPDINISDRPICYRAFNVPPGEAVCSYCPTCLTLNDGQVHEAVTETPAGNEIIHYRVVSSPIKDGRGRVIAAIEMVEDVSVRKRAEERIQRQLHKLSALRSIDLAISSSLDIRVTLRVFIDHVVSQLNVDAANVLLLNPHSRILEYAAERGFRTDALRHSHVRLGEGYAGIAALENRIVSIPDLTKEDTGFKRLGLLEGEDFVTYFGVPLVAKGRVKGVLEVFHRSRLELDEEWFEFLEALALQAAIAIDNNSLFNDLERSNMDLSLAYDNTIEGWSRALDYRDKETEGHSQRVTEMAVNIAHEMGCKEDELVNVRRGALLHDIGKMGIPDSVLFKPGALTEEEWKIMRMHPVYAYELLYPIAYLRPALDIPYCHHEKWDGSGYPRGLKGEQIPLSARIFAIVDVWDALRSDRPYRAAWSEEKAREYILSLSGIQFDPKVVEIFFRIIAEMKY